MHKQVGQNTQRLMSPCPTNIDIFRTHDYFRIIQYYTWVKNMLIYNTKTYSDSCAIHSDL